MNEGVTMPTGGDICERVGRMRGEAMSPSTIYYIFGSTAALRDAARQAIGHNPASDIIARVRLQLAPFAGAERNICRQAIGQEVDSLRPATIRRLAWHLVYGRPPAE